MPCDIGSTYRGACNWTFGSAFLNNIFSSPLWLSVMLTVSTILLIMLIYPCKTETPFYLIFKTSFYIFIFNFLALLVHNGVIKYIYENQYEDKKTKDLISQVVGGNGKEFSESAIEIPVRGETFKQSEIEMD